MIGISGMRLFESFQLDDQTSHQGRVGSIGVRGWPAVLWSTLLNFGLLSENYAGAKPGPSHRLQRHGVHRSIAPTAIECPLVFQYQFVYKETTHNCHILIEI